MCLSDPETAILIGGEADDQANCKDSIWKLEIGTLNGNVQYRHTSKLLFFVCVFTFTNIHYVSIIII